MDRRTFAAAAAGFPALLLARRGESIEYPREAPVCAEMRADLVIAGGGVGGCAAALAALRNGLTVVMTEETDWIGGQLTQQGVPPDENPWIETGGCTKAYLDFRKGVREYYRRHYPLTDGARAIENLDPGEGGVSRLCHEPRVALAVLEAMLAPYRSGKRLRVLLRHVPVSAATGGDRVESVTFQDLETGRYVTLNAPRFIDATELGDLLPLTGTEYVTGAESRGETGELHAPPEAQPHNMQSSTWCFAMDYIEGEDHTIEKPAMYEYWRAFVPPIEPAWPGKLLSWTYTHPVSLDPITRYCDPPAEDRGEYNGFWHYRRIAYPPHHREGTYPSGITLVNWPQNDYMLGNFFEVSPDERQKHLYQAMQLSYSLLYWMQTEAPRRGGGTGWPGLRLRGDLLGAPHGLAKYPYIREARRIRAEFTVLEQHVGAEMRSEITGKSGDELKAESFGDTVGVGYYRIDLHPSTGGDNYIDIGSLPFQIPLGSLIPKRVENLLPACKNLGVTHITNGCYRLHPVEWNIGEAAGMLAAHCHHTGETHRGVRNNEGKRRDFQALLERQGFQLAWP